MIDVEKFDKLATPQEQMKYFMEASLQLADPGVSVAVRDETGGVEYLG